MILVLVVAVKSTRTAAAETSKQIKLPSGSSIFYTIILYISDNYMSEISIEEPEEVPTLPSTSPSLIL